jgi:hypothetical protein
MHTMRTQRALARSLPLLGALVGLIAACADERPLPSAPLAASEAAGPVIQSVTGSGHVLVPAVGGGTVRRRLTFEARRYADGSIEGSFQLVAGAAIVHGTIGCFAVTRTSDGAATARLGGTITDAKFTTFIEGTDTGFFVVDDGEGGGADDRAGRLIFNAEPGTAAAFCDGTFTDPRAEQVLPLYAGNVQIQ